MKRTLGVLIVASGLCAAADAPNVETNDISRAMLQELRQIRTVLEQIAGDTAEFRKNESEKQTRVRDLASRATLFQHQGPDIRQLAEIKLPDPASKDQIKKYILDIIAASQGQARCSGLDPQVAMLAKVGADNIKFLIDALSTQRGLSDYYIELAIEVLADEKSKSLILEALPIYRNLVKVIVQRGWECDAKPILLAELKNPGPYLPTEWITAVVRLNDTNSFPLLRDYFIKGQNKSQTYQEIEDLPIENMAEAVDEAWQNSKNGDEYNRQSMAIVALKYGHKDALSFLIDFLTSDEADTDYLSPEIRQTLLQVIDVRGSNQDLAQWFKTNRENLRFDPKTKKFVTTK